MNRIFLLIITLSFSVIAFAQEKHRFETDVETIVAYDKIYEPSQDPIVFVGSSSIRKWGNLPVAFGNYNIINRGIGGAVIDDITYYLDQLVFAYKPRQIVLYVGENNLPNDNETPDVILNKTVTLYKAIRARLPQVPIVYIAMKPSPSRDKYQQKCKAANDLIKKFLASEKNTSFADVYTPMLANGKSRPELFVGDMLHMNAKGYTIWEKLVEPYLLKPKKATK
jgi:lysophospholipase L1-like esterase